MQRMAMVIGIRPDRLDDYAELHARPWPEMNAALTAAHIGNYSIFLKQPENLLFGYWEYYGTDFAADMARLGALPVTKRWLTLTDACQQPLGSAPQGEKWSCLKQVFHLD
jgi:L-rhamnose mutarotase